MWRLHWRRAIFYSAITKRQHVSPRVRARAHARVCVYRASMRNACVMYEYLLTGVLFTDNDDGEACDDEVPAADLF